MTASSCVSGSHLRAPEARLLDEQGSQHELVPQPIVAAALRAGDGGVAQVRGRDLVGFVRL